MILVSIAGTLGYNRLFGASQAVTNEEALQEEKDRADTGNAPVTATVTNAGDMWKSWLSPQILDVAQDAPNYGYPGDEMAVNVGRPRASDDHAQTSVTLDLTGLHNTTVRVTGFRAVVDERTTPPNGTIYFVRPQGDSPKGVAAFDFGDDSDPVDGKVAPVDGVADGRKYLDVNTVTIAKDETVGFVALMSVPPNTDLRYHFEFDFDTGETVSVYNDDAPFRLVSYPDTADRGYMNAYAGTPGGGYGDAGIFPCDWPGECQEYANNLAPR